MALEIERKFLLANDEWKRQVIKSERLRDGLIGRFGEGKVRVRLTETNAWLTIKGPREGISRPEFEYEIPRGDAERMLRTLCQGAPFGPTAVPEPAMIAMLGLGFLGLCAIRRSRATLRLSGNRSAGLSLILGFLDG